MKIYVIHYLDGSDLRRFECEARDSKHAQEQHNEANPNAGRILGLKPKKR